MKRVIKSSAFIPALFFFFLFMFSGQNLYSQTPNQWPERYVGTWKLTAQNGEQRYIVLRKNRTAVTTFGEKVRGNWLYHPDQQELRMQWDNDWADVIIEKGEGYEAYGYAPGTDPDSGPSDQFAAEKVGLNPFEYFGVWEVMDESGKPVTFKLNPRGSVTGEDENGEKGSWTITDDQLLITWDNGWRSYLRTVAIDRYEREAYAPGADLDGKPTFTSRAERIKAFIKPGVEATVY